MSPEQPGGSSGFGVAARHWPVLVLIGLSIPLFFVGLGSYSLVNGDEGIYHSIAAQMVSSGDWIHLYMGREHRIYDTFMNAPLQYWGRATLITFFGDNYWTMRIGTAGFALATVVISYRMGCWLGDRRGGFLAGLIQLTTAHFIYLHSARTGELEPVIAFGLALTAFWFLKSVETGKGFVRHHLAVLLIMSMKTPLVALPLIAELACFAVIPAYRTHFARWLRTALWILPLGLAWHLWRLPELWGEVWEVVQSMAAEASSDSVERGVFSNLGFYARAIFFGAFPYALVYPLALGSALRREASSARRPRGWVICIFPLVVCLFYLVIGKRHEWYIIPVYPFLSVVTGCWLSRLSRGGVALHARSLGLVAVLGALLVWVSVDATTWRPLAEQAFRFDMQPHWQSFDGVPPLFGVVLTALALAAGLFALRRLGGDRLAKPLAVAVAATLLGYGGLRSVTPLAGLGNRSEMAQLHARLSSDLLAGRSIAYPVRVPGRYAPYPALFYFAEDFEIVEQGESRRRSLWLYAKDDPSVRATSLTRERVQSSGGFD